MSSFEIHFDYHLPPSIYTFISICLQWMWKKIHEKKVQIVEFDYIEIKSILFWKKKWNPNCNKFPLKVKAIEENVNTSWQIQFEHFFAFFLLH